MNILFVNVGSDAAGIRAFYIEALKRLHAAGHHCFMAQDGFESLQKSPPDFIPMHPSDPRFAESEKARGGVINGVSRLNLLDLLSGRDREEYLRALRYYQLIVYLGGDGTAQMAGRLEKEFGPRGFPRGIVFPRSMDGDAAPTGPMLGYYTSVSHGTAQIGRLQNTSKAVNNALVVEVMGRDRDHYITALALNSGAVSIMQGQPDFEAHAAHIKASGQRAPLILVKEYMQDDRGNVIKPETIPGTDIKRPMAGYYCAQRLAALGVNIKIVANVGYDARGADPVPEDIRLAEIFAKGLAEAIATPNFVSGMLVKENGHTRIIPGSEIKPVSSTFPPDHPVHVALDAMGVMRDKPLHYGPNRPGPKASVLKAKAFAALGLM